MLIIIQKKAFLENYCLNANNSYILSQEYPNFFNSFHLRKFLAACFSKHESPFGHLATWIRVKAKRSGSVTLTNNESSYLLIR